MTTSETITRYLPVLKDINSHIETFNVMLSVDFKIPVFDTSLLYDDHYFHILNGKKWKDKYRMQGLALQK